MNINRKFFDNEKIENPYENNNVNISWSQLRMFYTCPRSYKLKYIDKKSENPINIHLIFGTAIHTVLQKYLEVAYENTIKEANELDLDQMLLEEMRNDFKLRKDKGDNLEVTKLEMKEFLMDGVEILKYFKNHRKEYFPSKNHKLLGIETQLHHKLKEDVSGDKGLYFLGYIDILIYDESLHKVKVIDIKTSTKGWKDYKKKDKNTTYQLVAYKKFLSEKFNIKIDTIEPSFIIFKRKINKELMYPPKRIQEFIPSHGTVSLKKVDEKVNKFVKYVFDENLERRTDVPYPAVSGFRQYNCTFCEFRDKHDLCNPAERVEKIKYN